MGLIRTTRRMREATAASATAQLERGTGPEPQSGDGDADDQPCPTCGGSGVNDGQICLTCDGSGSAMQESTSGAYWAYPDDPEWEQLREAARTFSTDVRKKYAAGGVAMKDGSYPIPDKDALGRAVQAYGRSPDPATKAHIIKRARALGASDALPDDWKGSSKTKEAEPSQDEIIADLEQQLSGSQHLVQMIREARPESMTPTFSQPTRVKTSDGREGYKVVLIREGGGNKKDDQWYLEEAVRELCESGAAEGMQAFSNHPDLEEEELRPERDVKELVGTYHDVKFVQESGKARADAIFVPLTLDENHPKYGWVVTLAEAAARSNSPQPICGISLYGLSAGDDGKRPDGSVGRMVSMIRPSSADIVTNAGAGGGFIRQLMESARALRRTTPNKEIAPMNALAYQKAVQEAAKRVREADSDEARDAALSDLTQLEAESIDSAPSTVEQLREAAPKLVQEIETTVKADAGTEVAQLQTQLREAQGQLGKITEAIGLTDALREAGIEDSTELKHYAGMAQRQNLSKAPDIKEMVETDRAIRKADRESLLQEMREALDLDSDVEGIVARVPALASLPTDGGLEALREAGLPIAPESE